MIRTLLIKNFKCFSEASFAIRALTILTGVNGGGKSTVLQSILLAREAALTSDRRTVQLNGPYGLSLGEAQSLLNPSASEAEIRIGFQYGLSDEIQEFRLGIPDERALHLTVDATPSTPIPGIGNLGGGFTYLSAERLGPRDLLAVSADEPNEIGVGVQGEFTAQVLALREMRQVTTRLTVREELQHANAGSSLPRLQAEAWASEIIRPIQISAQWAAGISASTIRFQETGRYGAEIRPANTGFGVSYALPIIIAGLLSLPGDVLLVENPEAHLHPAGQSRLGRFLAQVAGSGVQVILETHSDHVLNGARLAVAEDSSLAPKDTSVHYFDHNETIPITISKSGELSQWPSGFFDQIEADLGGLARARRRQ